MAKSSAKLKVVKDALNIFRENGNRFREIKNLVAELGEEKKSLQGGLEDYTKEHGDIDPKKGEDKFILIDNGIKWAWQVIRQNSVNSDAAVNKIEALKATSKNKKLISLLDSLLTTKPVIDVAVYETLKNSESVPEEIIEVYEVEKSHTRFNHYFVDKIKCVSCSTIVSRTHKFCHQCGTTVEATK